MGAAESKDTPIVDHYRENTCNRSQDNPQHSLTNFFEIMDAIESEGRTPTVEEYEELKREGRRYLEWRREPGSWSLVQTEQQEEKEKKLIAWCINEIRKYDAEVEVRRYERWGYNSRPEYQLPKYDNYQLPTYEEVQRSEGQSNEHRE